MLVPGRRGDREGEEGGSTSRHEASCGRSGGTLSLIGAAMVLGAFAASQRGSLSRTDVWYNVLNLVGSTLLTIVAVVDRRLGFILLEGLWALFSIPPPRPSLGCSSEARRLTARLKSA